jgi:hypothetical protein
MISSCNDKVKECHKYISVQNLSDKNIYVEYVSGYPDTNAFANEPSPAIYPERNKVLSGQPNLLALQSRNCWEDNFKSFVTSDTLMVYIFDGQVLDSLPWDSVKAKNLILKRYDLSLQDIHQMHWSITYP